MLIKYKKSNKKVAMGLISLMTGVQDLNTLQKTIYQYENDSNWQLYLWKQGDDYLGMIGVERKEHSFIVHHAAVIPSYRNEGIGHKMVEKVQEIQDPLAMSSSNQTKDFLSKCWESNYPL